MNQPELSNDAAQMLRDTFTSPGFEILRQRLQWLAEEHKETILQQCRHGYVNEIYPEINREAGRLEGIEGVVKVLEKLEKEAARAVGHDR